MTQNLLSRVFAKMWPTSEEKPTLEWFSYISRLADYLKTQNCEYFTKRHSGGLVIQIELIYSYDLSRLCTLSTLGALCSWPELTMKIKIYKF